MARIGVTLFVSLMLALSGCATTPPSPTSQVNESNEDPSPSKPYKWIKREHLWDEPRTFPTGSTIGLNVGDVAADLLTAALYVAIVAWYLFPLFVLLARLVCCR
jgi:hypothetical protein